MASLYLIFLILLFGTLKLDFLVQNIIYRQNNIFWQKEVAFWHHIFYLFPKLLLIISMLYWFISFLFKKESLQIKIWTYGLALFYSLFNILLIYILKKITHTACPWHYMIYGGFLENDSWIFNSGPISLECFPAGHAITGLVLLSWGFIFEKKYKKIYFYSIVWGSIIGFYQSLRGAHFISHTLSTILLINLTAQFTLYIKSYYKNSFTYTKLRKNIS